MDRVDRVQKEKAPSDESLVREWGVKLAEEIEQLSRQGGHAIKYGHLQDALEEAQVVLEMAGHTDLARRALDIVERLQEARRLQRTTRIVSPRIEAMKREAMRLAQEMKKRLEEELTLAKGTI